MGLIDTPPDQTNDRDPLTILPVGARRALPSQEIHRGPISARLGKIAAELDTIERSIADLRKAIEDIKGLL
jgi:hypothetical protein